MSLALPGAVDTGITLTVSIAGSVRIRLLSASSGNAFASLQGDYQAWEFQEASFATGCLVGGVTPGGQGKRVIVLTGPDPALPVNIVDDIFACTAIGAYVQWSPTFDFTETVGPFRLGVSYEIIPGNESIKPLRAIHYRQVYQWFGDENTVLNSNCAGYSSGTLYWHGGSSYTSTPNTGMTPEVRGLPFLHFSGATGAGSTSGEPDPALRVEFTGLSVGGTVDTSGLDDGVLFGTGGGAAFIDTRGGTEDVHAEFAGIGWDLNYDLDVPKLASGDSTGAHVVTVNGSTLPVPASETRSFRNVSWVASDLVGGYEALYIDSVSAVASFDPDVTVIERPLRIWSVPGRGDPSGGTGFSDVDYSSGTLRVDSEQSVLRPDGVAAASLTSVFVASSGDISVSETDASTDLTVSATGSHITRTLGAPGTDKPEWRRWLGVGVSGQSDVLFNMDLEGKTKHTVQKDIFDWVGYGYARLTVTAPADGDLTLSASGVLISVFDNHETGSSRAAAFSVDESVTFSVSWTLPVKSGSHSYTFDLNFPDAGAGSVPFYLGRVDAIQISGFLVGSYSLTALDLIAKTPKTFNVKLGFGPLSGGSYGGLDPDYDALHISHNAAPMMANLADRTGSTELFSEDGRGVRFVYPLTSASTGDVLDTQFDVAGFLGMVNEVEGVTATYDVTAYEGANKDSYGNTMGPELAEWLYDSLPGTTVDDDTDQALNVGPKCGQLLFVNGWPFLIATRDRRGYGAVEGLAKEGSARAGIGETVTVTRQDNVVDYFAGTDAHGFFVASPLPQDGSIIYETA